MCVCVSLCNNVLGSGGVCALNMREVCNRLCVCVFVCDYVQWRLGLTRFRGKKSMPCVCSCANVCSNTHTHKNTQMSMCEWVYGWNLSSASQPQVQFVHTDTQPCLKHFLIKRGWQIIMIQRWLWNSLTYCNSQLITITFAFYQEQTQQRSSNINKK